MRWQHPQRGFLPPSEFIPLAEQTGLIHPLSRWVLEAALQQQQAWRALGIDVPVAVNLSRRTLHDPQLPETVAELLTRWDVAPGALVLEITESSLMADPVRAGENLSQLRALGVRMSIDDFGTGYSSLASLKNLPVDELKIDQSFVQAMATDASSRAIVRAIIDLADALELRVVAEGVEDRATWDVLAGLGCDVAQGYFLSRPIAAAEFDAWMAEVRISTTGIRLWYAGTCCVTPVWGTLMPVPIRPRSSGAPHGQHQLPVFVDQQYRERLISGRVSRQYLRPAVSIRPPSQRSYAVPVHRASVRPPARSSWSHPGRPFDPGSAGRLLGERRLAACRPCC